MKGALNVVVMLGGPSAEREVSLRSGAAVAAALRGLGHRVTELDPRPGAWTLPPGTDVVFLALHGTYGEDGAVQAAALAAFTAVGGRDYARVDVMLDAAGAPWVLEVNTLPGLTETSLLPKAAAADGLSFPALCRRMLELALRRRGAPVP
jgi:D-alanine-D-alanine ligase-like ATP-grasp enzyme